MNGATISPTHLDFGDIIPKKTIYNFYEATFLNISGSGAWQGTILAPNADVIWDSNEVNSN